MTGRSNTNTVNTPDSREEISLTPEEFHLAASVEHGRQSQERSPEQRSDTQDTVVRHGTNRLVEAFQQASFFQKAMMLAAGAGAIYIGAKILKAGYEGVKSVGAWVKEKLDATAGSTLKLALGIALGGAAGTALYEAIKDKMSMTEVLQIFHRDGAAGIGRLLVEKVRDGAIHIPQDTWNTIAGPLGLPAFGAIAESVSTAVSEGAEWLNDYCEFSTVKENMVSWFNEKGITKPEWLENMSLGQIAADMGINQQNVVSWTKYAGLAGGSFLIYRWLNQKKLGGSNMGNVFVLNSAVYLLLLKDGQQSFGREMVGNMGEQITEAKNHLVDAVKDDYPGAEFLINDIFSTANTGANILGAPINGLLDWAGEHPIEAMALGNAAWFFRAQLIRGLKAAATNGTSWALSNPAEAVAVGASLAALWYARGEFINRLIVGTYDDPNSAEATSMRQYFQSLLVVDPNTPPTMLQEQIPDFYKSLIEDPLGVIRTPEMVEDYRNGGFSVNWDVSGRAWLLIKGLNVPVQLAKLTWVSFTTTLGHIFSPEENENGVLMPMLVGGIEMMVFGSMAWGGFKSYITILDTAGNRGGKIWSSLKTLMPFSAEWRFILKSSLTTPIIPLLRTVHQVKMVSVANDFAEIRRLSRLPTPENLVKMKEICRELKESGIFGEDFDVLKKTLGESDFSLHLTKQMEDVKTRIKAIYEEINNNKKLPININDLLNEMETGIDSFRRSGAILLERGSLILQGKFREAIANEKELFDRISRTDVPPPRPEFEPDKVFKGKTKVQIEGELTALEAKARTGVRLTEVEMNKMALLKGYLDPTGVSGRMGRSTIEFAMESQGLSNEARAGKIKELARDMELNERAMQSRFLSEIEEIKTWAARNNLHLTDPQVTAKLNDLDVRYTQPLALAKAERMKLLDAEFKKLPTNLQTPELKAQMRRALEAENGFMVRFTHGVKGRMKMMAIMASMMFATDVMINSGDSERELSDILAGMGDDMKQLLLDVLPIAGTYSNFYSAFTGEELLTDNDVSSAWSRASNVVWGTVGAVGDILTVVATVGTGGLGGAAAVPANIALRLAKAAKSGSKTAKALLKIWPKLQNIMERMGGVKKFAEKLFELMRKGADKVQGSERVMSGLRTIQRVGTGVGIGLLAGGAANMVYGFVADVPEIDMTQYQ